MIRAIIFDLGGIIIPDTTPYIRKQVATILDIKELELDSMMRELHPQYTEGRITLQRAYQKILDRLHKSSPKSQDLLKAHLAAFSERMLSPYPDVIEYIDELKKGHKVACLTNTEIEAMELFKRTGIFRHFDAVFISTELKMRKPHTQVYRHVLKKLRVKPEHAIFVDDRIENVIGARNAGLHAVHYSSLEQLKKDIAKIFKSH